MFGVTLLSLILLATTAHGARLPYIVGGENIDTPGKYPWQGSLQVIGLSHFCGCIVLSDTWMLSASSCFLLPSAMTIVLLGAHDVRTRMKGDPHYYTIAEFIRHPDFSTDDWDKGYPNDIGLIRLNQKADLNSAYIGPIDMAPENGADYLDAECYMTGWGFTLGGILPPNVLKQARTDVINNTECDEAWTKAIGPGLIHDTHLCVGGKGKNGACSGDSGGPIFCKSEDKWLLVGVTSWGMNTCDVIYPTVGTRVSSYRKWITEATKGDIM